MFPAFLLWFLSLTVSILSLSLFFCFVFLFLHFHPDFLVFFASLCLPFLPFSLFLSVLHWKAHFLSMDSTVGLMVAVFRLNLQQFCMFAFITVLFVCFLCLVVVNCPLLFLHCFRFSMNSVKCLKSWFYSCLVLFPYAHFADSEFRLLTFCLFFSPGAFLLNLFWYVRKCKNMHLSWPPVISHFRCCFI